MIVYAKNLDNSLNILFITVFYFKYKRNQRINNIVIVQSKKHSSRPTKENLLSRIS